MKKMKSIAFAAAFVGSAMLSGGVQAADYGSLIANGAAVGPPGSISGIPGGVFQFTRTGGDSAIGAQLLNGPGASFIGFCLELGEYAATGITYRVVDLTDAPTSGPKITFAKATDLAKLVGGVLSGSFANVSTVLNTATKAAAFQLAIWEIVNETAGNAYGTSTNWTYGSAPAPGSALADVRTQADAYLATIAGATAAGNLFAIVNAGTPGNQDYFVQSVVPIPAAAWLLGSGLLGLFGLARRKKVATAA